MSPKSNDFVPDGFKKRRKHEKNAKNIFKNEKSFEKGIDKANSYAIIAEYEKIR